MREHFADLPVLIVDDEPINLEISKEILTSVFRRVDLAEDGLQAAQSARNEIDGMHRKQQDVMRETEVGVALPLWRYGARATAGFPRRDWAANRALLDDPQTPVALSLAIQQAHQQLQAARAQRSGPSRAR